VPRGCVFLRRIAVLTCLLTLGGCGRDGPLTLDETEQTNPGGSGLGPDGPTRLRVRVVDAQSRALLPAMVSFWDARGRRLKFGVREIDDGSPSMGATVREVGMGGALATWHGFALWRGEALLPVDTDWEVRAEGRRVGRDKIPLGRLRVVASRGTEYELAEATIDVQPYRGDITLELPLSRAVDRSGYLAADMHVHSAPGSTDAFLSGRDRLKTLVVAGIDVAVSADHDFNTDLAEAARELWGSLGQTTPLLTLNGNEATYSGYDLRPIGHFNVFPVTPNRTVVRNGAPVIDAGIAPLHFLETLRTLAAPRQGLVQLNHARLGYAAYFDDWVCQGWLDRSHMPACPVDFDALEVLNGYLACGSEIENALQDWYALLGFGRLLMATGNSDSHGTTLILAGFPRTYVRVADDGMQALTERSFMEALRGRRAIATTGPFLTLRVEGDAAEGALVYAPAGTLRVSLRMQAASWVKVEEVHLKVNGQLIKSWPVPRVGQDTPLLEISDEPVVVREDAFITAEAWGREPLPSFVVGELHSAWPKAGCAPQTGARPGMPPFAVTNPVLVDVDGDGRWKNVQP
jgi:predicted small lipoprotein YifL